MAHILQPRRGNLLHDHRFWLIAATVIAFLLAALRVQPLQ